MSATTDEAEREHAGANTRERPVEERAEQLVERVAEQVTRFARRLAVRAREEAEDIVAEAQTIRRGGRPPG
jgi:DNA-directed RNA polymerase specialized sigma subunit